MARIQILELPTAYREGREETPFALIVDEIDPADLELTAHADIASQLNEFAQRAGARAALLTELTVDIPANDASEYVTAPASDFVLAIDGADPLATVATRAKQQNADR